MAHEFRKWYEKRDDLLDVLRNDPSEGRRTVQRGIWAIQVGRTGIVPWILYSYDDVKKEIWLERIVLAPPELME